MTRVLLTRRAPLAHGGVVLGAAALAPFVPRGRPGSGLLVPVARAAARLDTSDPLASFSKQGNEGFITGQPLALQDRNATVDPRVFYAADADAARANADDRLSGAASLTTNPSGGWRFP